MLKEWQLENHFFCPQWINWLQKRSAVNKIIRWKISGKLFSGGESYVILSQVDLWGHYSRVPWTARRSSQPILKEINPEYSLKGPMLKLKFQCFGYLIWRADSLEKTLRRKGWRWEEKGTRRWDGWLASLTQWTWVWASSERKCRTQKSGVLQSMGFQSQTQLSTWTTVKIQKGPIIRIPRTTSMLLSFSRYPLEHRLCTGSVFAAEDMMNAHRWFLPCGAYNPGYFHPCCVCRLGLLV